MSNLRTAAQQALEALEFMADEWGPKQFGKFGFPASKGYPPVITCSEYKEGRHYSLRDLLRTRENKT